MIIHKVFLNEKHNLRYLCNQAIEPKREDKMSFVWSRVNCKNCLKNKQSSDCEGKKE